MSKTPDKNQITAIKISKLEKSEKTVTQYRALQTDRKAEEKPPQKTKSPLMIMLLLKKKFRARLEYAFVRINLQKNKASYQKIVASYMSSILRYKIKTQEANAIKKLGGNVKKFKNTRSLCLGLSSWMKAKIKAQKILGFGALAYKTRNAVQQTKQEPKYQIPSRPPLKDSKAASSVKKPQANRSLDLGNKSVSASKLNLNKKIDFDSDQGLPQQIDKIRKQNQQLKLMELSEDAREVLKKVQRFDRFIYAQQSQKICKDVLMAELKRLEKIKNSQKDMRIQYYDNQLTITALFNHIKLIAEMNRDIFDLSKMKQKYDADETRRKEQQFKANLSNRRNKAKQPNAEATIKTLTDNIEGNLFKKDYEKARQEISILLTKYQKDESIQDRVVLYRALLQSLSNNKDLEKSFEDLNKTIQSLASIDISQSEASLKALKQLQKEVNLMRKNNQKTINIIQSFETFSIHLIKYTEQRISSQKQKPNQLNLTQQIENQRNKSKSLSEKIKDLQRLNKQQNVKIFSIQKERKQLQSGRKPPSQNKSTQILKTEAPVSHSLQIELKQSKQKIQVLQKEILALKKQGEKKLGPQKKEAKLDDKKIQDENIRLQEEIKKLQQEIKTKRQKEAQQKAEKTKQFNSQTQITKTITTITTVFQTKNLKQLQIQINKLTKLAEKDERLSGISLLLVNLVKMLVQKQNSEATRKKQLETLTETQGKDKQKLDVLLKMTKQSQAEIKNGLYLSNPDYWDKYLTGIDARSSGVIKDLIKILKILTLQIKNRTSKLEQMSSKTKAESSTTNNILEMFKNIETQINKKQFFKGDDGFLQIQSSISSQDKIVKAIFRLIKKFSQTSRIKLSEERKLTQKSIKSYENELQKMNNFISQYQIKLKQKEQQYQDLYKSFTELQKQGQTDDQKKSTSLRGSRKSVRSNSSQKQTQIKNIKASMQVFAEEEKNMLERLQMSEQQKIALVERINYLEHELNGSLKTAQQLRLTIKALQKNISDEHNNYQRQYESWRQKTMLHSKEIETIRLQYERQFEKRQQKIVQQFENISKERETALEKYHRDLTNVQVELNKEITHLREQLHLKNVQVLKNQEFEVLRRNNQSLEIEYAQLKSKLAQFEAKVNSAEQINAKLQTVLKENGQNQAQLLTLTSKNRELQQEIQRLKVNYERSLQEERSKASSVSQSNVQLQNKIRENGQLHQEVTNLNNRNRQLDQQISNLRTNWDQSKQRISALQLELRTAKSTPAATTVTNTQTTNIKITQLEQQIARLRAQQEQIITNQVNFALKNQEEDFNRFLVTHDKEIEDHFFNIIIPQKLKEAQPKTQIKQVVKEGVKEVIRTDPQQEVTIRDLRAKLDDQARLFREVEQKFISEQNEKNRLMQSSRNISDYRVLQQNLKRAQQNLDEVNKKYTQQVQANRGLRNQINAAKSTQINLKEQVKKVQTTWQIKLRQQITINQRKIYEIQHKFQEKPQEFSILQSKIEELNRRIIQESKIKTQIQNKLSQSITMYQSRFQEINNQKTIEISRMNNEMISLRDRNNELSLRLTDKEKQVRTMEESLRTSQSTLSNLNHQDCERKYRDLEQRMNKEIAEQRNKLVDSSKSGREEIELLKQVINNHKIESTKFESMLNSFREARDEALRQKQAYYNQLRTIANQKDLQIQKIRSQYQNRITTISIQKTTLQNRLTNSIQTTTRPDSNSPPIKVLELESKLTNKEQQIKTISELAEKRRRELQEQHQRYLFVERENENMKMVISNLENHIMRLQTDISYFNNEVHKYKMALIETESRETVLRNDLMRVKTESDKDTSMQHLRQEIATLKDQIIRITSTNINQIHTLTHVNVQNYSFDTTRIRKMIHNMESHRGNEQYGYDEGQLDLLKRINQEVTELVAANRQLQTKCVILETNGNGKAMQGMDIIVILQDRMEGLVNFLLDKGLIDNGQNYSRFIYTSRQILAVNDMEAYFNNWLQFMKSMFLLSNDLKSQELRQKAQEMLELKQQMNQILDKHIEFVEDESYETLDKYKMIFSDIRILLREYMNTRNEEYIHMIWRSLEPHEPVSGQPQ